MSNRGFGKLITLEGPEGSGKSTQARVLYDWLKDQGHDPLLTREPGGTELGRRIRDILLETGQDISPAAEILLYGADRAQHVEKVIAPALRQGRIVLCDRYMDSTTAYQGFARGLGPDFVCQVNRLAVGEFIPDLTLLYDVPVVEGLKRKMTRSLDRIEMETLEFHEAVREGYLCIAETEARVRVIDARQDLDTVTRLSIEAVSTLLKG